MTEYRVGANFETVGGFWKPGTPEEIITGTIACKDGRSRLLVSPTLSKLALPHEGDFFRRLMGDQDTGEIHCLNGHTREGLCSLLHLTEDSGAGLTDLGRMIEISADRWRISALVMGLHMNSAHEDFIEGAAFYFTKIHHLLPIPWRSEFTADGMSFVAPHQAVNAFRFQSNALDAEVICEIFARGRSKVRRGAAIKPIARVRIVPRAKKSLDWFVQLAPRLENFFTLLMGTSVLLKSLQLFRESEEGWFIRYRSGRKEKVDSQALIQCSLDMAARALERWLEIAEDKRPVEKTVLGMMRRSRLFEETKFLALSQALEGFGRLRFAGKVKFTTVLEGTYDVLSPAFASKLLGDRALFVQQAVQTRNYFTHLGVSRGPAVLSEGKRLFLLNQKLHALLRCVMLLDMGIEENFLLAPISHQAKKWS